MHAQELGPTATSASRGLLWAVRIFLISLTVPIYIPLGPILLVPHRLVLLVLFVPLFMRLFISRTAGPVVAADWLLFGSAIWAAISLGFHHGGSAIEPAGIHMIEFFGAYLLARVAIRSWRDFEKMVWFFFVLLMIFFPFILLESVTHRNILLDIIPGAGFGPANTDPRWGLRRAQASFAHPILLGVFVSTAFGLMWYATKSRWIRLVGAPVSAVATICSMSTGALLAIVVQCLFISWEATLRTLRARWKIFTALSIAVYLAIDLLSNRSPFHVLVTYATFSTGSAYNRILIWNFGTQNIRDNPVFGLGMNDWIRPSWMGDSVDNFWLLFGMRYGLPAIIMILAALALILRSVARAQLNDVNARRARAGYLVAFGGLFIAGGTVHYWHAMMAFAMFIFGSGLWALNKTGDQSDDERDRQEAPLVARRSRYTRQSELGQPIPSAVGPVRRSRLADQNEVERNPVRSGHEYVGSAGKRASQKSLP